MYYTIPQYLDNIVDKYNNKVAYIDQYRSITFGQLQKESFSIANYLIQNNYHKTPILLFMEKSVSLISCFLGVAISGNFYSPVDTKMPAERIIKILEAFLPSVIITDREHVDEVNNFISNQKVIIYEELVADTSFNFQEISDASKRIIDTDILYVLFTSGSTGIPKGVIINHRAVIDFIEWISMEYHFDETTVFANQAQLYFDLSIQDVFAPLRNGSTTVLISNRLYASPIRVWKEIIKNKVNTLVWIPSMLSNFANLDVLRHVDRAMLKTVLFCGEVMPMKQLNYWISNYPDVTYGNLYGPTECTEACTYYTLDRTFDDYDVLPMGKACGNSEAIVVNDNGDVISQPNEIGELYMRGTCLSMGYYGNAERTQEAFVQNPLNNKYPEIVYKTGDLVCYNDRMELVYISRKDFQIKIRGYRVELGEIEAAANAINGVDYCCCLFDDKREQLILVYSGETDENKVTKSLKCKLQDYMIPTNYIKLDKMIFNVNGKVDRKALIDLFIKE